MSTNIIDQAISLCEADDMLDDVDGLTYTFNGEVVSEYAEWLDLEDDMGCVRDVPHVTSPRTQVFVETATNRRGGAL